MIPVIGFLCIEYFWGLEEGIIAAIILGIGEVAWVYYKEKRFEPFAISSALLVIIMGEVSWYSENRVIILLKPAIIEGIFASIFLVSSLMKKPFMLVIAKKQFGDASFSDFQLHYFNGLNFRVGILFLLHTLVTIYAAFYFSSAGYAFVKGVLFYIMFAIFFAGEFIYSRFFMRKRHMQEMADQQMFLEYQRRTIQKMRQR